jgi:hypothetical protein
MIKEQELGHYHLSDTSYQNPNVVISERGSDHHHLSNALHRRSDIVSNKQGSLHLTQWVRGARKLVGESKIRLGSWNVGSLTDKLRKLVDTTIRRCVNILCVQETKWTGQKTNKVKNTCFKLWHTWKEEA